MAVPSRPATLTLKALQSSVGDAVKKAVADNKLTLESGFAIGPGTLVGPRLRAAGMTIEAAEKVAVSVTAAASKAHATSLTAGKVLEPGFVFTHGHIICGFWPPPGVLDGEILAHQ